ncbi:MAG: excinuclease ABC subunit UvrA [Flavobacteriales bacterium]|nr:excinuclease ABC subunit UvrA [Flavobacteriales bacterium]
MIKSVDSALDALDPKKNIIIRGAKMHNLKDVSLAIPRNKMVVITGLSGSGKSSLAFDTLYAEGQRRYVESLSSYARQFLGRLDKPEVDSIEGISPAVAIEQKVTSRSSRSTVGTSTEIYDYIKLLYARIGKTFSPISGEQVKRHTVADIRSYLSQFEEGTRYMLMAPVTPSKERSKAKQAEVLLQQGFSRIRVNGEVKRLDKDIAAEIKPKDTLEIVVDRLSYSDTQEHHVRLADSAESAFFEGSGECLLLVFNGKEEIEREFNNRFELDGLTFEEPSPNFFSFNNPIGACKRCEGFGQVIGIDEDLVIPNKSLSIYDDAVVCWKGDKMSAWKDKLVRNAREFDFPIHRPYHELTQEQQELLWTGNKYFKGLNAFFKYLEEKSYKIQYRVMLSRYRGRTTCPECKGTRLRKDANYVKINGTSISELVVMPCDQLLEFFNAMTLGPTDAAIAERLLIEVRNRLGYLCDVGLGYLTLNRLSSTLSGGESQRINLSTCLGSSLVGSMYILDEPSIGLHPRDTQRLIKVLKSLRDLGNTVIVVEHDEEIMEAADHLIDIGPYAGTFGGEIVFEGDHQALLTSDSLTSQYLTGRAKIPIPPKARKWTDKLTIKGARENNLKNITVDFPLHTLTVVSGVSGSGKSTLVSDLLYPAVRRALGDFSDRMGQMDGMVGDVQTIKAVEYVDQNPIGKSSRSNPVTYVKAFDEIRSLFSSQQISKVRGYKPAHFSFNVAGGRCDNCEGEGLVTIEMQFMADIKLQCDVCKGKRYKDEILEVNYRNKSISDILEMTVDEAIAFFGEDDKRADSRRLVQKLLPVQEVGLGYLGLGQSSSTLSGGEAQRIKLASFLAKGDRQEHTLFIFDEPTTGLHFYDVKKLLDAFQALIKQGHSLIVIEHNTDVIKGADWVIDLGPDGGVNGGELVFCGTPQQLANHEESLTAQFIAEKLN